MARHFNPGAARIEIAYSGDLPEERRRGSFQTDPTANDSYIFTQFEPMSARRAIPCFDEPALQDALENHLARTQGYGRILQYSDRERNGRRRIPRSYDSEESKPLPSYLVAMAVGPFEIIDGGTAGKNKTPLRVITTRGHRDEAKYALEITPKVFSALENYFGVPYPYEKLDQITIPVTVAFGAMENAGLITYRILHPCYASAGRHHCAGGGAQPKSSLTRSPTNGSETW